MPANETPASAQSQPPAPARSLEIPLPIGEPRADALRKLIAVVDRLRAPDGCAWDREQTLRSVAPHLIEEAHELLEAIEVKTQSDVVEEAGDVLMGVVLLARIAEQAGQFDLAQVAEAVSAKLVRRHPHVFGSEKADTAQAALGNWERIKQAEREQQTDKSALAGVPTTMGALQRAQRLGKKAVAAGFRWADDRGALDKLREEIGELEEVVREAVPSGTRDVRLEASARAKIEHELGDVLIAAVFLGNYLSVDPEAAARQALRRFEARFRDMELTLGRTLADCSLSELMAAWKLAKSKEKPAS